MSQHTPPLSPVQLLEEALKEERAAYDFYASSAANCKVFFLSELLTELRDEEAKHVKMIQTMLTQLRAGVTPKLKR